MLNACIGLSAFFLCQRAKSFVYTQSLLTGRSMLLQFCVWKTEAHIDKQQPQHLFGLPHPVSAVGQQPKAIHGQTGVHYGNQ